MIDEINNLPEGHTITKEEVWFHPELGKSVDQIWFAVRWEKKDIEKEFLTMRALELIKKELLAKNVGIHAMLGEKEGWFYHTWQLCSFEDHRNTDM